MYISRDLDSRFSDREQAAVEEWLNSSKKFHIMRDHPRHRPAMLGGTWGCKLTPEVMLFSFSITRTNLQAVKIEKILRGLWHT